MSDGDITNEIRISDKSPLVDKSSLSGEGAQSPDWFLDATLERLDPEKAGFVSTNPDPAKRRLEELEQALLHSITTDVDRTKNLQELYTLFLQQCETKGLSPATIIFYSANVPKFLWYLNTKISPPITGFDKLRDNHVKAFYIYLQHAETGRYGSTNAGANKPLNANGIRAIARAVRTYVNWSAAYLKMENPHKGLAFPKDKNEYKVDVYTDAEISKIFTAIDQMPDGSKTGFVRQRTRAFILLLMTTGLRLQEILDMKMSASIMRDASIEVMGKGSKKRHVPFSLEAKAELYKYITLRNTLNSSSDMLWLKDDGSPCTIWTVKNINRRLKEATGLKRLYNHRWRHLYGTKMNRKVGEGVNPVTIQKSMGHSSFGITQRYYIDTDVEDIRGLTKFTESELISRLPGIGLTPSAGSIERKARVELPSGAELQAEVDEIGQRAVARKYNCSPKSVRNRLKKYQGGI